jgi:hypothetical protein
MKKDVADLARSYPSSEIINPGAINLKTEKGWTGLLMRCLPDTVDPRGPMGK